MYANKLCPVVCSVLLFVAVAGCEAPAKTKPSEPAVSEAEQYKSALEKPVTVSAAQSPDGSQLTVQYAAIAICNAAGVPYQFDKSRNLAGNQTGRFIPPLQLAGDPANQALSNLLAPLGLRYEVDDNGVYLCR